MNHNPTTRLAAETADPSSETVLEMRGITKAFPGVTALNNVDLIARRGEIHAVVGENGAGKSTLMKVLSGVYPYGSYEGEIIYRGEPCQFRSINDSERLGIIIIHQELALVPQLSIAENIFLGNERARGGVIDWTATIRRTRELLRTVGLDESPETLITDIGVGKQQLVEIAKALSKEVELLILDEPTASLNERDSDALLELLLEFKRQGITSILISHKLNEISKVADSITVLRDGATVDHIDRRTTSFDEGAIVRSMVGRELTNRYPDRQSSIGDTIFEVRGWNAFHPVHHGRKVVSDVDLRVARGEVVGLAGLMGSGRTELAMSIFGASYGRNISGSAYLEGREVDLSTVQKAVDAGLAYVTEDRKTYGLILGMDVQRNVTLSNLPGVSRGAAVIDSLREHKVAQTYRERLNIRCSSVEQETGHLSGGNQQKVVLSKWLFAGPEVLILDEPTRGIDVGAKYEIYTIINQLADEGKGIIIISSELSEILGVCDRIYVMNAGKIIAEMPKARASQERIMQAIVGTAKEVAA